MRQATKLLAVIASAVIIIMVLLPGLMSMWVKHSYLRLVDFYNTQGNFKIQVKSYHKHWFCADAVLAVQKLDLPQVIDLTVLQHITNGPLIFTRKGFPLFKLAAVKSKFQLSSATAKLVQPYSSAKPMLELDDTISFSGKYRTYFHSDGFKIIFATGEELQAGEITGNMTLTPYANHVKGKIKVEDVDFTNPQINITSPECKTAFDQHKTPSGLWIGKNDSEIKSVTFEDVDGKTILLSGIRTQGKTTEASGKLTGTRHLVIDNFQFNEITIGPLDLQVSVNDLNAQKVAELFSVYKKIYYSAEKMPIAKQLFTIFPTLVTTASRVKLDNLKLTTLDGEVTMNGDAQWPYAKLNPPVGQTTTEFLHEADAQGFMRISTSLAKQLLSLAADLKLVAHRMTNPHLAFIEAPKSVDTVLKQNSLMFALLVQNEQLSQATANHLEDLQLKNTLLEDYSAELDKLYADKQISQTAKKMLRSQYENIQIANLPPDEKLQYMETQFEDQFYDWIKEGYIKEEGSDYIVSVIYKQGKMVFNGKAL
jgi:uncharacterized protein YdgA (DUF945 family)